MKIDPNDTLFEKRTIKPLETVSHQYTQLDAVKDAVAAVFCAAAFFVLIWIAFAMDVITTGM